MSIIGLPGWDVTGSKTLIYRGFHTGFRIAEKWSFAERAWLAFTCIVGAVIGALWLILGGAHP